MRQRGENYVEKSALKHSRLYIKKGIKWKLMRFVQLQQVSQLVLVKRLEP